MKNKAAPKGKDLESNKIISYIEETNEIQNTRVRNIEDLALYDDMLQGVLGSVKKDLAAGLTGTEILAKYSSLASARIISIAAMEADSGKALAAAKDILDRVHGKAKEVKDVTHRLAQIDEKQIDAILISEISALEVDDDELE